MKSKALNLILIGVLMTAGISGCNQKLKRADSKKLKEIEQPFDSKKYFSDKKDYRAVGEGRAMDLTVAKRIAETNARQSIASQIEVQIRSVGEQFLQNRSIGTDLETKSKYEDLTRSVVDQTLSGVKVVDAKSFQNKKGMYVHYVAMEMPVDEVERQMEEGISRDEKLKQDFELQKFREVYNEELNKFSESNNP